MGPQPVQSSCCDICNISRIVPTNLTHHSCCNVIPILICDPHSDVRRFEQCLFCIAPVKLQVYKVFMEVFYMTSKNEEVSTYDDKHSQTWHDDYFHSSYCWLAPVLQLLPQLHGLVHHTAVDVVHTAHMQSNVSTGHNLVMVLQDDLCTHLSWTWRIMNYEF